MGAKGFVFLPLVNNSAGVSNFSYTYELNSAQDIQTVQDFKSK